MMEQYLLEDFLNGWLTRNDEILPAIRKHKEKAVLPVPAAGVQSAAMCEDNYDFLCHYFATLGAKLPLFSCHKVVLQTLAKRYAIFPAQTRKRIVKAWAATEAATMRGCAVHALLLARRSSGSKSTKIRMLKELIASAIGSSDVDAAIEAEIQACMQDQSQDGSADSQSSASIDGERMDQDDLLEDPKTMPPSILKAVPCNVDKMETQLSWWDSPTKLGCKAMIEEDKENDKRAPVQAAPPNLRLSQEMVKTHEKDLEEAQAIEAVSEQLEVQKAARLAAAANKVAAAAKKQDPKHVAKGSKVKTGGRGRGRGRGRGAANPRDVATSSDGATDAPATQAAENPSNIDTEAAENPGNIATEAPENPSNIATSSDAPAPKAKAKAKAKAKSQARFPAPDANALGDWSTKAAELKTAGIAIPAGFDGSQKSYTLSAATYNPRTPDAGSISVLWTLNTLYVNTVVQTHDFPANKKGGCNLTRSKYGNSFASCWKAAKFAAGWTDTLGQ